MKIEYSNWNVANVFPDDKVIEIHKELPKHPKLYYPILKHELGHDSSLFNWKELKHDLIPDNKVSQWKLLLFMIHNPKSFTQLLPFYYSKKRGFRLDINMSLVWIVILGVIGGTIFFSLKYF